MSEYAAFHRVRIPQPPTDPITLAWVAGYADAESCLSYRGGCAGVSVSNCHLPTLLQLCEWFGGTVRCHSKGSERRRPCFQWYVSGPNARACLRAMMPNLREKLPQAELILAEPVRPRGHPMSLEDLRHRDQLKLTLSQLKRVRYPAAGR